MERKLNLDNVPNLHCGSCKNYRSCGEYCKRRIDHKNIKYAKPWFKCYDANQFSGVICSEFKPSTSFPWLVEHWNGFQEYWQLFVEAWLPYKNTNKLIWFTIGENESVWYGMPLLDYVYGNMYNEDGTPKFVKKMYYKQTRTGFGYKLITEDL